MNTINKELISLIDEVSGYRFDFDLFIEKAKQKNIHIDYSILQELSRSYPRVKEFLLSETLTDFIGALPGAVDFRPKRILELDATNGTLLSYLVNKFNPINGSLGILNPKAKRSAIEFLTKGQMIDWQPDIASLSNTFELKNALPYIEEHVKIEKERSELFIWMPHITVIQDWQEATSKEEDLDEDEFDEIKEKLHDAYIKADMGIADAINLLIGSKSSASNKVGIFTASLDLLINSKRQNATDELLSKFIQNTQYYFDKNDVYIDAAFQISDEVINLTNSPHDDLYLIVARNKKDNLNNRDMFVAQLTEDSNQNSIILNNYAKHRPGRFPQEGFLLRESEFNGLDILISKHEVQEIVNRFVVRSDFEPYSFNQIAKKTTFLIKQRINNNFSSSYNCLYIPLKPDHSIAITKNEFTLNEKEYVQITINSQRFYPLSLLIENEKFSQRLKALNWNSIQHSLTSLPYPLSIDAIEINFNNIKNFYDILLEENCIYLPKDQNLPVITSSDDFALNQGEYIQIVLNVNQAFAPYLAKFLNMPLGKKIRDGLLTGHKNSEITKHSLESGLIFLPNVETQKEISRINLGITNLISELAALQRNLFESPIEAKAIEIRLKTMSNDKGWEVWMEELPFPMSSILWAYFSTVDNKAKLEHISHFFEASVQFLATICLSAVAQDKEFYRENQKEWNTDNSKHKGWYKNASFGSWYSLHASLSKFIRRLMMQQETKSRCLKMFGNTTERFVYNVTSKKLLSIFETANKYRNLWIGHSGRLDEKEAKARVSEFEILLAQMREVISDCFSQITLISPKTNEYADGLFEYRVKILKGTRAEFKESIVKTKTPMDKNKLYILSDLQLSPLEVLPFGRLMPSPKTEQNAFYFYSRFDNNSVRWVSYHFEKDAEIHQLDTDLIGLMKELFGED